jgi:hypothetical protein
VSQSWSRPTKWLGTRTCSNRRTAPDERTVRRNSASVTSGCGIVQRASPTTASSNVASRKGKASASATMSSTAAFAAAARARARESIAASTSIPTTVTPGS